jgi:hypothetical protein
MDAVPALFGPLCGNRAATAALYPTKQRKRNPQSRASSVEKPKDGIK